MSRGSDAAVSWVRRLVGLLALACTWSGGCALPEPLTDRDLVDVEVVAAPNRGVSLDSLRWEPADAVVVRRPGPAGRVVLTVDRTATTGLRLEADGACPVLVDFRQSPGATRYPARLRPWIDLGPPRPQLGFDQPFELRVEPGCVEAMAGTVSWQQVSGPALPALEPDLGGFLVRGRMPALQAVRPGPLPWGIVPFSQANRGLVRLQATWRDPEGRRQQQVLTIAAASRASGLPSLAAGQKVLLGGDGWQVKEAPRGARLGLATEGGLTTFTSLALGRWVLEDGEGRRLALSARRYDRTRLDCGRPECHPSATAASVDTRMTRVLALGLEGELGDDYDPSCALACHAVGEPGLPDGGFAHAAWELDVPVPSRGRPGLWAETPRMLRRLGGVGCSGCHGPATVPEESARWAILRSDVCAVCHDAPPDYPLVSQWRSSAKAETDHARGVEGDERCEPCHDTAAFLLRIGVDPGASRRHPRQVGPFGIACAACHAPHGRHTDTALVRALPTTVMPSGAEAAAKHVWGVCVPCHSPGPAPTTPLPAGSAAAIYLGFGGLDVATGAPLRGPRVHRDTLRGCLTCHGGPASGHTFRDDPAACVPCHGPGAVSEATDAPTTIEARARAMWVALVLAGAVLDEASTVHGVHGTARLGVDPDSAAARAVYNVGLVLADRGAAVHNAPYARALLEQAERFLESVPAAR